MTDETHPRFGWHGLTKGEPVGDFWETAKAFFLAHDRGLAFDYADGDDVLEVQDLSRNPLLLLTPEAFRDAWRDSGAQFAPLPFHPRERRHRHPRNPLALAMGWFRCLVSACGGRTASPLVSAAFVAPYAPPGPLSDPWGPYVHEASGRFRVPEVYIREVMRRESGCRQWLYGRPITSRAGAMGLMQIMPRTWRELRDRFSLGPDHYEPRDNILAGPPDGLLCPAAQATGRDGPLRGSRGAAHPARIRSRSAPGPFVASIRRRRIPGLRTSSPLRTTRVPAAAPSRLALLAPEQGKL
jgi:hypothetical protein